MISACLGALVGLIRQWSDQKDSPGSEVDFGGVRTHTFWAILGCTGAFLAEQDRRRRCCPSCSLPWPCTWPRSR
jgi:hypothetical protein